MKFCNLGIKRNVCSRKACIGGVSTVTDWLWAPDWIVKGYTLELRLISFRASLKFANSSTFFVD